MCDNKSEVERLAREWVSWDQNKSDSAAVQAMLDESRWDDLDKHMSKRIAFGTAGLRARMAPGYTFINDLVVIQTAQGLCKYLEDTVPDAKSRGLAIGYDGRHNSKTFAELTAATFLSRGHTVYMFSQLAATPLVAFAVSEKKCAAGVMVTASHNPKQDNGYKVYWGNGCQIIPPHDKGIAASILANLEPWKIERSISYENAHLHDPTAELFASYEHKVKASCCWTPDVNADADAKHPRITYTAMHGVGQPFVDRMTQSFGLRPFIPTKEQSEADPEFPTVTFPNPEEGKGALKLAIATAERNQSKLILANDPDADRMAVAEQEPGADGWRVFNGNEIGAMLAEWVWLRHVARNPDSDPAKCVMLSTAVSSSMLGAMAKANGFKFEATLTGFKWLGNRAKDLIESGHTFLFAYEEAIGFMIGDVCFDKDGVRAAGVFAELTQWLYAKGLTVHSFLDSLYEKYGYFRIETNYFFCYDPEVMARIFDRLRTANGQRGEVKSFVTHCGDHAIKSFRDQTTGLDSSEADGRTRLPVTPGGQMITFVFENGTVATVRGSGTEPKLKYYIEVAGRPGQTRAEVEGLHATMTDAIVQHFLQPKVNALQRKKAE